MSVHVAVIRRDGTPHNAESSSSRVPSALTATRSPRSVTPDDLESLTSEVPSEDAPRAMSSDIPSKINTSVHIFLDSVVSPPRQRVLSPVNEEQMADPTVNTVHQPVVGNTSSSEPSYNTTLTHGSNAGDSWGGNDRTDGNA